MIVTSNVTGGTTVNAPSQNIQTNNHNAATLINVIGAAAS